MTMVQTVIKYSKLSYREVMQMPCDLFFLMKRNASIDALSRTEEGREYLKDCKRLETTTPDYEALRRRTEYKTDKERRVI